MARVQTDADEVAAIAIIVAQALKGGSTITAALELALKRADSKIAMQLNRILEQATLGLPIRVVLAEAAAQAKSPPLEEFLTKLQVSGVMGSALADQLNDLVFSLHENIATQKQERASKLETKMLLPLVFLVLPVTVMFALYPSLQILNLQMEGTL